MRMRIHVGYILIASTYIAATCSILLSCRPFYKYWQINPDPGSKDIFLSLALIWIQNLTDPGLQILVNLPFPKSTYG